MKRGSFVAGLALALSVVSVGAGPSARACENGFVIQVDPRTGAVSQAEKLVNQGKPDEAARTLLSIDRTFATAKPGASRLGDRALLVLAKSVLRSDGRVTFGGASPASGDRSAPGSAAWAVEVIRSFATKRSDEPALASDLGEALSRVPSEQAEAKRVLESLEKRDVVASPYAYAALARLRAGRASDAPAFLRAPLGAFEGARREIELARCAAMTKDPAMCKPGAAGS